MRVALLVPLVLACGPAAAPSPGGPPAVRIDHVYVPTSNAGALAALLRDSLGLPEVWAFAERNGGASAGLSLGNAVLELLERPGADGSGIEGIALWPSQGTEEVRAQLRRAGLRAGRSVRMRDGTGGGWVLTGLADFPEGNVFLCEYLDAESARRTRARGAAALEGTGGGALGLLGVREVVVMSRDPGRQRARWGALAAGATGPAVRVVPGERDAVVGLVLAVRDEAAARAAWPSVARTLPVTFVTDTVPAPPLR